MRLIRGRATTQKEEVAVKARGSESIQNKAGSDHEKHAEHDCTRQSLKPWQQNKPQDRT